MHFKLINWTIPYSDNSKCRYNIFIKPNVATLTLSSIRFKMSQHFPRQSERSERRAWVSSDEDLSINYVLKSGLQMSVIAVDQAIGYDVTIIEKWEKVFPLFCSHIPGVFGPGGFHLQKRSDEIRHGQWPKKTETGP